MVTSEAVEAFRVDGWVQVKNVLDPSFVEELHAAFVERYRRYLVERDHVDALDVGHRRYMISVDLEPPFADPQVYANASVMPIIEQLLGPTTKLFSFGSVVSLPGAREQHVHRDLPELFGDAEIDGAVPPFAVTVLIPLVDLDDETGTTRVWPGSHRQFGPGIRALTSCRPVVHRGDALLIDYRLQHAGTRNRSSRPRPILYNVYARPWFNDVTNYRRQAPLRISAAERHRIPPEHRDLLRATGFGAEEELP